jgi:nicotinamidase-related amidase
MAGSDLYLVLDMINDIVHDDGPNGKGPMGEQLRQRGVIGRTKGAIAKARAAGLRIGYVRVGFSPDYKECPANSPVFSRHRQNGWLKLGTWGCEVHPELTPEADDFDIVKHRVSPFYGTALEPMLRVLGARRLVMSGVSTNAVVQAAMRDGHDRDFECVLLEDCCAAFSAEEHQAAVAGLARFGSIVSSQDYAFG